MIDLQLLNDALVTVGLMAGAAILLSLLVVGIAAVNERGKRDAARQRPAAVTQPADESLDLVLR